MLRRTMLRVTIVAQSAYVSDPIAQHVVVIDLELKEVTGEIELGFAPSAIAWLGIAAAHEE